MFVCIGSVRDVVGMWAISGGVMCTSVILVSSIDESAVFLVLEVK